MHRRRFSIIQMFLLAALVPAAAVDVCAGNSYGFVPERSGQLLVGGAPAAAKSDTIQIYGGRGRLLEGKFQDSFGQPDWNGWTSVDLTQSIESWWHVDTYHCDFLDPGTPGNHAWWCGRVFEDDCGTGDFGGYGNDWTERLDWIGHIPDPTQSVLLEIGFDMAHDTEPGYDYLQLSIQSARGREIVVNWDGADTLLAATVEYTVMPADPGEENDEILLRFEFRSDGVWSDEDCLFTSRGAAQIDNISVRFDGVLQGVIEDCEGAPQQWTPTLPQGVGDFAKVWQALRDRDPCRSNGSTVVAFIDDGEVVPGTGGYHCQTWCYGPGGYVVNPVGGLAGPDSHIDNHVVSPPIALPGGDYTGVTLHFDQYQDSVNFLAGLYEVWSVRSTADPTGETGWSEWDSDNIWFSMFYDWRRIRCDVSGMMEPGARWLQIRLGVHEIGWVWGWIQTDSAPAPYYDNVSVQAFALRGPALVVNEAELLQDGFPACGIIDTADPGANDIRLDMARSISPAAHLRNDPGDSCVATVVAVRTGSVLSALPRLYYKVKPNPLFDPYRGPGFATDGYVSGDSVYTSSGTLVDDKFSFDLPDVDWFYPGDVLHYFFRAQDDVGGDVGTSLLPADTTGFSTFDGDWPVYDSRFIVRGLPTLTDVGAGELATPPILFWNDFANRGAEEEWAATLANLSYIAGVDYDVFQTHSPTSAVGNGLGGRATSGQLEGYDVILYEAGNVPMFTITNVDYDTDPGDDVGVLDGWLRLGGKKLALFGDDVVSDMLRTPQTSVFVSDWLGIEFNDSNLNPLLGSQATPTVGVDSGNGVFNTTTGWVAYGGCIGFNTFDAVTATTGTRLAHFLDPSGADVYPYSAATLACDAVFDASVIHVPYGFHYVYTPGKAPLPSAVRTQMLEEILTHFHALPTGSTPAAVPSVGRTEVSAHPNPFNPVTEIRWSMPGPGRISIDIHDLRGRRIRSVVCDEAVAANGSRNWDGRNEGGEIVASGVYFAQVSLPEDTRILKVSLIK